MRRASGLGLGLGLGLLLACACTERAPDPIAGLEARVSLDRTGARVGDAIGVTIEIDAPTGFVVGRPGPQPGDDRFYTDSIELLDPMPLAGGARHHIAWTLRARRVGNHRLPVLDVPLVRPDGEVQTLSVGALPLPVLSVREELAPREAYFDIRAPPAPRRTLSWGALAVAGGGVLAALALLAVQYGRTREPEADPDVASIAREAVLRLDAAFEEPDPRRLAAGLQAALRDLVAGRRRGIPPGWTPDDLPDEVDGELRSLLARLERLRFRASPAREDAVELGRAARVRVSALEREHEHQREHAGAPERRRRGA